MVKHYNPSLRQEPRYQAILIIPSKSTESLLDWLKRTGRLEPRKIDSSLKYHLYYSLFELIRTNKLITAKAIAEVGFMPLGIANDLVPNR